MQRKVTYPIPLLLVCVGLCPELLDAEEQTHTIANLLDAHLLEDLLVHLEQVLAVDVVFPEHLLVVAALDAAEVFAHTVFIPVLDGVGTV